MPRATYFRDDEIEGLDQELVAKLDLARKIAGVPFVITSGKRDPDANSSAGGVSESSHLTGLAVDLRADSSLVRFAIVKGLLGAGFTRIGVYDRHCHADLDKAKPQGVLWTGESHV